MINFHCTIIPVVVLGSVIAHTSAWFLDREIHQLVNYIIEFPPSNQPKPVAIVMYEHTV